MRLFCNNSSIWVLNSFVSMRLDVMSIVFILEYGFLIGILKIVLIPV